MYIWCFFYIFQPHRAIFRQHPLKESTALCTCSISIHYLKTFQHSKHRFHIKAAI
jgi:hypothetical protein